MTPFCFSQLGGNASHIVQSAKPLLGSASQALANQSEIDLRPRFVLFVHVIHYNIFPNRSASRTRGMLLNITYVSPSAGTWARRVRSSSSV